MNGALARGEMFRNHQARARAAPQGGRTGATAMRRKHMAAMRRNRRPAARRAFVVAALLRQKNRAIHCNAFFIVGGGGRFRIWQFKFNIGLALQIVVGMRQRGQRIHGDRRTIARNRRTIAPPRKTGASPKTFPVPRQRQRRRSRTIASWILAKGAKQAAAQLRNGRGRARKVGVSRRRYSAPPKKARRRIPPPRLRALVFCRQCCGGMNLDAMFLEATPQKFAGANFYPPPQAAEGEIGFGCFVIGKIILHWGVCFLMTELQAMQRLILTGAAGGAELVGVAKAGEIIAGDFRQRSQHKGARQHARMRQG